MKLQFPASNRRSGTNARGFSLLELVVAVSVVAILAAIAIPSYQSYTLRSHRTDAKTALLDMASLEERFFSTNNSYSQTPSDLGYAGAAPCPCAPFPVGLNGYYQITNLQAVAATPPAGVNNGTPATYTITASAIGNQVNDTSCLTFTVNSAGQQTATPNPNGDCWQK